MPFWMNNIQFKAVRFGTAKQLGFESDIAYFEAICNDDNLAKDTILQPEKGMRPDGIILFKKICQNRKWQGG